MRNLPSILIREAQEEAREFFDLVSQLAVADEPAIMVLFTIRSDSYEQLQTAKGLEGMRQHTLSLPPMPKGAYAEVIKGPARRLEGSGRGLQVEDALIDALLHDVEEGGAKDALPLLAFTLERLYREVGGDGTLKLSEYEELGRVKGSIEAAVERALAAADKDPAIPQDRAARLLLLRRGFIPWLAGIDPDTSAPRRNIAKRSEIPDESRPLIDLLVEQRLLATDISKESGEVTIEPVHEALLRQWGLLQGWLEEDLGALTTLEGVKRAASEWAANGKDEAWLSHAGTRLDEAEEIAGREDLAGDLTADAKDYLKTCRAQEEARQRERITRLEAEREEQERRIKDAEALAAANKRTSQRTSMGLVAALVLVGLAGWQWWKAGISAKEAEAQRDRAEHALNLATDTANGLIYDLAQEFRNVSGVPAALIKDILDRVRKLQDDLVGGGESSTELQRSQSAALNESVLTLLEVGETDAAYEAAVRSMAIAEELSQSDPSNALWQEDLSVAYDRMAAVSRVQGNLDDALRFYQQSLDIREGLAKANPSNPRGPGTVAYSKARVGDVLAVQGKVADALKAYEDSLSVREKLVEANPSDLLLQDDLSVSYERIG
ncbi:MAG: tetratricopeptide repeat protein, partial [Pseudomonadota bacterium]